MTDIRKSGSHSAKRDDFVHVAPSKGDFILMPVEYYLPRSSSYSPLLDTMTRNQLIVYIKYLKSRSLQTYYGPLIQLLMQHKDNHGIFNTPVDPDAENLPTYYSVISKPMDLGTIRDRLASGEYQTQRDILNDIPYGWGEVFDISNRLVYVGFRVYNEKVCFGRSYYPLTGILEYEGNYCKGKRWGYGRLFDANGLLEYEGLWLNNEKVNQFCSVSCCDCVQLSGIHSLIHELSVGSNCCSISAVFSLHHYNNLQTLKIDDQSFANVRRVRIQSNPKLKHIFLGSHVFEHVEDLILDGSEPLLVLL